MAKIEWKGGECPVSGLTNVRTWWTDGGNPTEGEAGDFRWDHDEALQIIAYEIIEEDKEEPKQIIEKTIWDEYALAWMTAREWKKMTFNEAAIECSTMADEMMKARAK